VNMLQVHMHLTFGAVLQLTELPPKHMFVGKTHLTINDVRSFNNLQRLDYELHQNDCR
jgi:hypothetical protein